MPKAARPAITVVVLIVIWIVAAAVLPASVMPGPGRVFERIMAVVTDGTIFPHLQATLLRILGAFVLMLAIATPIGILMGLSRRLNDYLQVVVVIGLTVPSLVIIITVYMVAGLTDFAAVVAASLPTVPIVIVNLISGVRALDTRLIDLGRAYRLSKFEIVRQIILPQVAPVLVASSKAGLGLVWKMVLFVEYMGRSNGFGYQVQFFYQLFNMADIFAYTIVFLCVMLILEVGVLGFIEKRLFRWRSETKLS